MISFKNGVRSELFAKNSHKRKHCLETLFALSSIRRNHLTYSQVILNMWLNWNEESMLNNSQSTIKCKDNVGELYFIFNFSRWSVWFIRIKIGFRCRCSFSRFFCKSFLWSFVRIEFNLQTAVGGGGLSAFQDWETKLTSDIFLKIQKQWKADNL